MFHWPCFRSKILPRSQTSCELYFSIFFICCIQRIFIFKEKWLNIFVIVVRTRLQPLGIMSGTCFGVSNKKYRFNESVYELQFSMLSFVEVGKVRYIMLICALKNMFKGVILKSQEMSNLNSQILSHIFLCSLQKLRYKYLYCMNTN